MVISFFFLGDSATPTLQTFLFYNLNITLLYADLCNLWDLQKHYVVHHSIAEIMQLRKYDAKVRPFNY